MEETKSNVSNGRAHEARYGVILNTGVMSGAVAVCTKVD